MMLKIFFFTLYFLLINKMAFAYLDPGSGSYLFQLLIAAFIGAIFSLKLYWKKFSTCVKKLLGRKQDAK